MFMRTMLDRRLFAPEGGAGAGNGAGAAAGAGGDAGAAAGAAGAGAGAGIGGGSANVTADQGSFDWTKSGLDADHLGYAQNKGWKGPADTVMSYRNLEKLVGAPADQVLKLPTDDTPESWAPIYNKLGRPETADGYKLPVPDGADPAFSKQASEAFHKAGVSQKQAEALTTWWNEQAAGAIKTQSDDTAKRDTEQLTKLNVKWGANMQANSAIVDRAATAFGMTTAHIDGLKAAMGPGEAMEFLHNIGSRLGTEDSFIAGDGKPLNTGGLSPQQAMAKITELRADAGFVSKYSKGDVASKQEMDRLHKIAYPQG